MEGFTFICDGCKEECYQTKRTNIPPQKCGKGGHWELLSDERRPFNSMEVQTRSEEHGLKYFNNPKEAFNHAETDKTVWKISFGEVRLVKAGKSEMWMYEPMDKIIEEAKKMKY